MTGYQDQWQAPKRTAGGAKSRQHRVLFSWRQCPPGAVFMDFNAWHMVLNSLEFSGDDGLRWSVRPLSTWEERQIWKPSWPASAWLRAARRNTSVQAVVPELDLATANALWCRNETDRAHLVRLGFNADRIQVRRLRLER